VALENIGPIVINEDGSCGRLTQWHTLSDEDKEYFKLRVGQQNKESLATLAGHGVKEIKEVIDDGGEKENEEGEEDEEEDEDEDEGIGTADLD
jgi:hypothetical protein